MMELKTTVTDDFDPGIKAITDAKYALANPDVLHTPDMFRAIIKGLLDIINGATND